MKRFILHTLVVVATPLLLILLAFFLVTGHNKGRRLYDYKCELIENTPSPRIVITAGSNITMGINSQMIRDSLGINIVNYATMAPMGLKFIVDDMEECARPGDIVVFAPEYNFFYGPIFYGESAKFSRMLSSHREKWHMLNGRQWKVFVTNMGKAVLEELSFDDARSRANEYGDHDYHWTLKGDSTLSFSHTEGSFNEEFGRYFISKVRKIEAKGCKVLIVPPFYAYNFYEENRDVVQTVESFLVANGYPFLAPPREHTFPARYIFDSPCHPTYPGVEMNTLRLIKELRDAMR